MGYNQLEGTLPDAIGTLAQLAYLYVMCLLCAVMDILHDTVVVGLWGRDSQRPAVVRRDLSSNMLCGTIPASVGDLTNLMELCVARTVQPNWV